MRQRISGMGLVCCAMRDEPGRIAALTAAAIKMSFEAENLDMMSFGSFQNRCTVPGTL
jgi:hypothetical protein